MVASKFAAVLHAIPAPCATTQVGDSEETDCTRLLVMEEVINRTE